MVSLSIIFTFSSFTLQSTSFMSSKSSFNSGFLSKSGPKIVSRPLVTTFATHVILTFTDLFISFHETAFK